MKEKTDSIICHDKDDAKKVIDMFSGHVTDGDYLDDGTIKVFLDCRLADIAEK